MYVVRVELDQLRTYVTLLIPIVRVVSPLEVLQRFWNTLLGIRVGQTETRNIPAIGRQQQKTPTRQ